MPNPLENISTWLYHLGEVNDARISEIGASQVDLVVVDSEDPDLEPFTTADVAAMQGDNNKLVVSYLSIGEAETYRDYWDPAWETDPPDWIAQINPEWTDNVNVRFWDEDWQTIMFEMVDSIVEAGFNGLYLDIIDSYAYWEEKKNAPDLDYRALMVDFVEAIRARAEAKLAELGDSDRTFAIIGQNGEDLADDPEYLAAVDGIGKEDLYFYYPNGKVNKFDAVPNGWLSGSKELLETAVDAGVKVLAVEYVPNTYLNDVIGRIRKEIKYLSGTLDAPLYIASERDLKEFYVMVDTDGEVRIWGQDADETLKGTKWHDRIEGYGGDDAMFGRNGKDIFDGSTGNDTATGGRGADTFMFFTGDESLTITDFGRGRDKLALNVTGISDYESLRDAGTRAHGDITFTFGSDTLVLEDTKWRQIDEGDLIFAG